MRDVRLHLGLDAVTALRALGGGRNPDPLATAMMAELAGADSVYLQLRDDRRLTRDRDVRLLRESLGVHLDVVLSPTADLVGTAFDVRPDRVTLAPETRDPPAMLGALDAHLLKDALRKHVDHLRDADIEIGVRVAPGLEQIKSLHRVDVDVVVIHTAQYARAETPQERKAELTRIADSATLARRLNLQIAVGGALDLSGVEALSRLPEIDEVHVGHAIVSRATLVGMQQAVRDFREATVRGRRQAF